MSALILIHLLTPPDDFLGGKWFGMMRLAVSGAATYLLKSQVKSVATNSESDSFPVLIVTKGVELSTENRLLCARKRL